MALFLFAPRRKLWESFRVGFEKVVEFLRDDEQKIIQPELIL